MKNLQKILYGVITAGLISFATGIAIKNNPIKYIGGVAIIAGLGYNIHKIDEFETQDYSDK